MFKHSIKCIPASFWLPCRSNESEERLPNLWNGRIRGAPERSISLPRSKAPTKRDKWAALWEICRQSVLTLYKSNSFLKSLNKMVEMWKMTVKEIRRSKMLISTQLNNKTFNWVFAKNVVKCKHPKTFWMWNTERKTENMKVRNTKKTINFKIKYDIGKWQNKWKIRK